MPSETGGSTTNSTLSSFVRTALSVRNLVMVTAGVLAGASLAVLGKEVVVVPLLGALPGALVGGVGLIVALAVYRQGSCCDNCGAKECGCAGDCGDSCSYDP